MAICECGPGECEPIQIESKDLVVYALDRRKMGIAIGRAFDFEQIHDGPEARPKSRQTLIQQIGSYNSSRNTEQGIRLAFPVYLALARENTLLSELETIFATRPGPFLLLTPIPADLRPEIDSALKRNACAAVCLSTTLTVQSGGQFLLQQEMRSLMAMFEQRLATQPAPSGLIQDIYRNVAALRKQLRERPPPGPNEPLPEDVARRAFALVQQLDSEAPPNTRPPSVLTIFRLYCMEELNIPQIARKCRCSNATVANRLHSIRVKTGSEPDALRRFSPHLQKIEEDMSDSRAEHIHRRRLIYDADEGEEA